MPGTAIARLPPATSSDLTQLAEALRGYAEAGIAPNTRRAREQCWRAFESWCASVGACPLPAAAATVAMYLTARAPTLAASALAQHLSAIRTRHRTEGHPPPSHPNLDEVWAGIKHTHGRPPRKKRGLLTADLRRILDRMPDRLVDARNRAILLVGFAGAFRRGELASLSLTGSAVRAVFVSEGLEIHFDRSKGDQEGRGAILAIPFGVKTCPVAALQAWLKAAQIRTGPVFRSIDRHGNLGKRALSDRTVANIVKAGVGSIGLDPSEYSGHSIRRGPITQAHRNGATLDQLQAYARHSRGDVTRGYIEEADRFKTTAAGKTGL